MRFLEGNRFLNPVQPTAEAWSLMRAVAALEPLVDRIDDEEALEAVRALIAEAIEASRSMTERKSHEHL